MEPSRHAAPPLEAEPRHALEGLPPQYQQRPVDDLLPVGEAHTPDENPPPALRLQGKGNPQPEKPSRKERGGPAHRAVDQSGHVVGILGALSRGDPRLNRATPLAALRALMAGAAKPRDRGLAQWRRGRGRTVALVLQLRLSAAPQ
jgi:hypothetical protein